LQEKYKFNCPAKEPFSLIVVRLFDETQNFSPLIQIQFNSTAKSRKAPQGFSRQLALR